MKLIAALLLSTALCHATLAAAPDPSTAGLFLASTILVLLGLALGRR